jgi:hypothetical protein
MNQETEQSQLTRRDQARLLRAFGRMPYGGGPRLMGIPHEAWTVDTLIEGLDQLAARLAEVARENDARALRLDGHDRMFTALSDLFAAIEAKRR